MNINKEGFEKRINFNRLFINLIILFLIVILCSGFVLSSISNDDLVKKFKSVEANKDKAIVFEGFENSDAELTAEGKIKLVDGKEISIENIISSASKVKLSSDGKTLEYTLKFKDGSMINVKDSGDGQLTNKGYINKNGKTEFEYPYGNGKENLSITTKIDETGKSKNVYNLTGEGRAENLKDRTALRFVRINVQGNVLGTYFVRPSDFQGEVSFSVGENGDLKNEGQTNFDVLIPSDDYNHLVPKPTDFLKSVFTVGAGAIVQFRDEVLNGNNIPQENNNNNNLVIIGKNSAYVSSNFPVTIRSYDDSLVNGIISLTDINYYGSDGAEWMRYAGNNAYSRRSSNEPSEMIATSHVGNNRYYEKCAEGSCGTRSCPPGQPCPAPSTTIPAWQVVRPGIVAPGQPGLPESSGQSANPAPGQFVVPGPSLDPSSPQPPGSSGTGSLGLPGTIPIGVAPGFEYSGAVPPGSVTPQLGSGSQIGQSGGGICPSCGKQHGSSGGSEGRGGRFPRLRAFFARLFGRRR